MFTPNCLPILIGSLPLTCHREALQRIFAATPEIPLWPQLPKHQREGMIRQFLDGLPGLVEQDKRYWIATDLPDLPEQMTRFYEDYLASSSNSTQPAGRFTLPPDIAPGYHLFLKTLAGLSRLPYTVKGQITGPMTIGIAVRDQGDKPIFYDDSLRDMVIKLLAMKGCRQAVDLAPYCREVAPIVFIDEPGMVSFGSSAFIGITGDMVEQAMAEVIKGIHDGGGLAGIHICANGDWGPALNSAADIISFDAFSYFTNIILYKAQLLSFLNRGGVLAWGIVPTDDADLVRQQTVSSLYELWQQQREQLVALGVDDDRLLRQTLIAPACGTGSLPVDSAMHVLDLTARVSATVRQHNSFGGT